MDKAAVLDFTIAVIRRCDNQTGCKVLPRRCVMERILGWMTAGVASCEATSGASTSPKP